MLSTNAFNALLKILEEPPAHVKFMFATTEPHKIPITILSRCQRYDFGRISKQQIVDQLNHVLSQENIHVEDAGLRLIADAADGGMRDALSLLDQVLSFAGTEATEAQVASALGLVDRSQVVSLVEGILNKDTKSALATLNDVYQRGIDLKEVMQGAALEFRHLAVAKSAGSLDGLAELTPEVCRVIEARAEGHSLGDLQRLFSMSLAGVEQTARSTETKLAVELIVLKMLERPPLTEMVAVSQAIARLELLAKGKKPNFDILSATQVATPAPQHPASVPKQAPAALEQPPQPAPSPAVAPPPPEPSQPSPAPAVAPAKVATSPSPAVAPVKADNTPAPLDAVSQEDEAVELPDEDELVDMTSLMLVSMPLEGVDERWLNFINEVAIKERKLASHLEHAFFTRESSLSDGKMCLVFKKKLHHSALEAFQATDYFRDLFCKHFGEKLGLEAHYDPDFNAEAGPSIQKSRRHALEKAHAALRAHAEENPVVQKALDLFGGEIKSVERLS